MVFARINFVDKYREGIDNFSKLLFRSNRDQKLFSWDNFGKIKDERNLGFLVRVRIDDVINTKMLLLVLFPHYLWGRTSKDRSSVSASQKSQVRISVLLKNVSKMGFWASKVLLRQWLALQAHSQTKKLWSVKGVRMKQDLTDAV